MATIAPRHCSAGANEGEEFLPSVIERAAPRRRAPLDGAPASTGPEVWGARALQYAWDDSAGAAIERGLGIRRGWVREMCGKVVAQRGLPYADALVPLLGDDVAASAIGRRTGGSVGVEHVVQAARYYDAESRGPAFPPVMPSARPRSTSTAQSSSTRPACRRPSLCPPAVHAPCTPPGVHARCAPPGVHNLRQNFGEAVLTPRRFAHRPSSRGRVA